MSENGDRAGAPLNGAGIGPAGASAQDQTDARLVTYICLELKIYRKLIFIQEKTKCIHF